MSSSTEYFCEITNKIFKQKSHIDKHLKSKAFKDAHRIKELELEKLEEKKLIQIYGESNIKKILEKMSSIKIKKSKYEYFKETN